LISEISRYAARTQNEASWQAISKGHVRESERPKEHDNVKAAAREHTIEAIATLAFWMRSKDSRASVMAANELLDRGW
jgi:hypothetical protein